MTHDTNDWRAFRFTPDDVLFLRDGKPSTQGTDHYLRSLFPPHPATLYGALRTRRLWDEGFRQSSLDGGGWETRMGHPLRLELGARGAFGTLAQRGPWLVRPAPLGEGGEDEALLPAPADLGVVLAKETPPDEPARVERVARFRTEEAEGGSWFHPLALLEPFAREGGAWTAWEDEEPRSASGWFLTPAGIAAWQRGGVPAPRDFVHPQSLWLDEPRTGLGLEKDRRSARDGMLYTFGFIRLAAGVGLGFEVAGTALEARGGVRLGGEGRTGVLSSGPSLPGAAGAAEEVPAGGRFALSFLTPTFSAGGAWPPGFAAGRLEGEVCGRRCRLVAAAVDRFVTVGGWDLQRFQPKTLRRALAPGSTFVFEALEGGAAATGSGWCDFPRERLAQQGFGLCLAGTAP